MSHRSFSLAIALLGTTVWVGSSHSARAQTHNRPPSKTLFEQIDDFGNTLFGSPTENRPSGSQSGASRSTAARTTSPSTHQHRHTGTSRTGSAAATGSTRTAAPRSTTRSIPSAPALPTRGQTQLPRPPAAPVATPRQSPATTGGSSASSGSGSLHERLSAARQSPFGGSVATTPHPGPKPGASPESASPGLPSATTPKPLPSGQSSLIRQPATYGALPGTTAAPPTTFPARQAGPGELSGQLGGQKRADLPRIDASAGANSAPSAAAGAAAATSQPMAAPAHQRPGVLFVQRSPSISIETLGPRQIMIGKESAFEVTIRNAGDVAAEEVVVSVDIPSWAEVQGAEASTGATRSQSPAESDGQFRWQLGRLEAKSDQKLILRIVPRESRPFDLGVRWTHRPAASQTVIEVQEPKLAIKLDGPREVLFGKTQIFKLEVSNPGTGAAENVRLVLYPLGQGSAPANHTMGVLAAGATEVIEVELTARQTGNLTIKVEANADGDLHTGLTEAILVRRANLQVHSEGPAVQYVGTTAIYRIRVSNPGNAPAETVAVTARVPSGAKFLSGSHEAKPDAKGEKVSWTLANLAPGAEQVLQLQCQLVSAGASRLEVVATGDDLTASHATATRVEAIADLVLDVSDPAGPMPVGADIIYEIRVANRGSKTAENVEILAFFSQGVEPVNVQGGEHQLTPGQVQFNPIHSLGAGKEIVLKITSRAQTPGNHVFRAELRCPSLGTKLAGEETTLFYDSGQTEAAASTVVQSRTLDSAVLRTADRRQPPAIPPTVLPESSILPPIPVDPNAVVPPTVKPPATTRSVLQQADPNAAAQPGQPTAAPPKP